jgi:hypothetical protein
MKPYKLQLVQALKPEDLAVGYEFYREILGWIENELPPRFIFNDEATFLINGTVNLHNVAFGEQKILTSSSNTKKIQRKRMCSV